MNEINRDDNKEYKVPDYGQIYGTNGDNTIQDTNNGNGVQPKGHKKRDSIDQSTNIVDKMEDNNTIKGDSTTHFRKFSSTTKMAMIANEMKKSTSAENKPNGVERGSLGKKPAKKSRGSVTITNDEAQVIAEANDDDNDTTQNNSRRGRESTTIDNFDPIYQEDSDPDNNNDNNDNNYGNGVDNEATKPRKARGSQVMDIDQDILMDETNADDDVFGDAHAQNMKTTTSHQPQLSTTPEMAAKGPKSIGNTNDDDDE
eukprot:CAMPEP_0114657778 /NCGR_PEP_ID=MMETSP0191-20121206/14542_1 /TAXON_ID=126664 /ORGANISM="Sorites sp." /LENGTH=256 /DNA_ID=CAMNT_0001878049 /DNA_START=657 /DNA_END=1427 /DNA_ORIENTATION=+